MKRLLLIGLLLLTAGGAEARQVTKRLAIMPLPSHRNTGASSFEHADVAAGIAIHEFVRRQLDNLGVDYITIPAKSLPTGKMEWVRHGVFILGPDTITVSAVLHERACRRGGTMDFSQYRPDSLMQAARLPTVPQLWMMEPNNSEANILWGSSTACSLGTVSGVGDPDGWVGTGSGVPHECEGCSYVPGSAYGFLNTTLMPAARLNLSGQPAGGVLPLLGTYGAHLYGTYISGTMPENFMGERPYNGATGWYGPTIAAAPDTAYMWKRTMSGINTTYGTDGLVVSVRDPNSDADPVPAAQVVFACAYGGMSGDDLLTYDSRSGWSQQHFFLALAALDSIMGGRLLGENKVRGREPLPLKQALTIDGAFAHSSQHAYKSGTYIADSTAVKATFDSLAAYGIPYLVGVNVDSVASYPNEIAWFKGSPRFTPQVWRGADGGVCDTTTYYKLTDLFGHSRARTSYGPARGRGYEADTSQYALFTYAFTRNDSLFQGRSSRFLLPPFDDYVATNGDGDSTIIAAYLAGATGMRISGIDTLRQALQTTNVQGRYFGLKLLAHSGEMVTGGSRLLGLGGTGDAFGYFVSDSGYAYDPYCQLADRHFAGLLVGRQLQGVGAYLSSEGLMQFGSSAYPNVFVAYDASTYANGWGLAGRSCIIKAHMSALGGDTYAASLLQPQGEPLRPDWWRIRTADGFRRAANALAGRMLVMWAYPESIEP